MAGKITFIQPLGHNPYGDNHSQTQLPQQYGSVIFGAGSLTASSGYGFQPSLTQNVPIAPVGNPPSSKTNRVHLDTSPGSGNRGALQLSGGGKFDQMQPGQYVMQGAMKDLAGSGNSLLNSPQALRAGNARIPNAWHGDTLAGITGWDYVTGFPTYNNVTRGNEQQGFNPLTATSGVLEPMPTDAVPGRLVFNFNGQVPASSVYGPRHDS
jgi:hypothetical protein